MKRLFAFLVALMLPASALAHHPLGGLPMQTFGDGLLSGFGHPLLGFDHLFFVVAVGIAATFTFRRRLAPLAYIGTMLIGCLLVSLTGAFAGIEVMVALSLLVVGTGIVRSVAPSLLSVLALFSLFGFFHGAAFGETIAAAEAGAGRAVLIGYLIGLGVIQYVIALAVGALFGRTANRSGAPQLAPRFAGAMVAGVGLFLTLEQIEGPLLGA